MEKIEHDNNNYKKKRGRPRKDHTTKNIIKNKNEQKPEKKKKKKKEAEIVLQLPITKEDIDNYFNKDNENDNENNIENVFIIKEPQESSTEKNSNVFTLTDVTNSSSDDNIYDSDIGKVLKKLEEKDELISTLKDEIRSLQGLDYDNKSYCNNKKLQSLNLKMIDVNNGNQVVISKTKKRCWWDHHTFNNLPCFLPDKFYNKTYYVFGCFCSPNCAAAYNIETMNDYRVSERYSLLKQLYINEHSDNINIASPWQIIDGYGGSLSIKEYRKNNILCSKKFKILHPPLVYITPVIEEEIRNNCIGYDNRSTSSESDEVLIKRSKPLPGSNNTLIETMGLEVEKRKKN